MNAPQLLGVNPARRRIEMAGFLAQCKMAERDAARREAEAARLAADAALAKHNAIVAEVLKTPAWAALQVKRYADTQASQAAALARAKPTARSIIAEVIAAHGFTARQWPRFNRSRKANHVLCRHEMAYRLHNELTLSLLAIGRAMGGFDHATVLHSIRRHTARLAAAAAIKDGA